MDERLFVEVGDISRSDRNVQKAYYDESERRLYVVFSGGAIYVYKDVPKLVGEGIFQAESGGRYLNEFVKPYYQYERIK